VKYLRISWETWSFLQQASGQMFKDDVNGFSSTSVICFRQGYCTLVSDPIDLFVHGTQHKEYVPRHWFVHLQEGIFPSFTRQKVVIVISIQGLISISTAQKTVHSVHFAAFPGSKN
jgi:hypothetical protein